MSQTVDIRELNERIESKSSFVNMITMGMDQVIVGQKHLVESLMIGLLSDGHILLEGVPGFARIMSSLKIVFRTNPPSLSYTSFWYAAQTLEQK